VKLQFDYRITNQHTSSLLNPPITATVSIPEIHSSSTNGVVLRMVRFTGMLPLSANHQKHEVSAATQTIQNTS
jgi:hypothetical protein